MVRGVGLEPTSLAAPGPKPGAFANFASRASHQNLAQKMEKTNFPIFKICNIALRYYSIKHFQANVAQSVEQFTRNE